MSETQDVVARLRELQRHFDLVAKTGAKHERPAQLQRKEVIRGDVDHMANFAW